VEDRRLAAAAHACFSDRRADIDVRAAVQKQRGRVEVAVLRRDVEERGSPKREKASTCRAKIEFGKLLVHK
jgi:hypothetical protein